TFREQEKWSLGSRLSREYGPFTERPADTANRQLAHHSAFANHPQTTGCASIPSASRLLEVPGTVSDAAPVRRHRSDSGSDAARARSGTTFSFPESESLPNAGAVRPRLADQRPRRPRTSKSGSGTLRIPF